MNFNAEDNLSITQLESRIEYSIARIDFSEIMSAECDDLLQCDHLINCDNLCDTFTIKQDSFNR